MDLDWIVQGLLKPGKTRSGLAAALGRKPSAVTALLAGNRQLKALEVPIIARYLDVSAPIPSQAPSVVAEQNETILTLAISGEAVAGVWRERGLAYELEKTDIAVSTRWPVEALSLLRVRGSHLNRKAIDGDLLLCLAASYAPRSPLAGDWVTVERVRSDLIETSVRRVVVDRGVLMLVADSDDPAHQGSNPIAIGNEDGFRITGFVIQFIKAATSF